MVYEPRFNEQSFLSSDYVDRLLTFAQKYDEVFEKDVVAFVKKRLEEKRYYDIRHFLRTSPYETTFTMPVKEFSNLSVDDFRSLRDYYKKVSDLIETKIALHEEILSFYDNR